ncbi:MAG TPA: glycosyltransferase, partial [Cytophagaceae bacterium]
MDKAKTINILIASVLKPIDEVRMYKKIAQSIDRKTEFSVHIFSQGATSPIHPTIQFHPMKPFTRLSFNRLFASWKCLILMVKLKPKLFMATTHELLIVMTL